MVTSILSSIPSYVYSAKEKTCKALHELITRQSKPNEPVSAFRQVFQTSDQMKESFVKFLQTIFYKLDDKLVLATMEKLLQDPHKTDEQIYKELLGEIGKMEKRFAPFLKLYSLDILRKGMGKQAAQLLKPFEKSAFNHYMEIYDRRYLQVIRKMAKLPLRGMTIGVCNTPQAPLTVADRIQSGTLFGSYPYKTSIALNDPGCTEPFLHPEQTHKPIGSEVADNSLDLISCLGGLHHLPPDRLDPFLESLNRKLKPGGVILVRDHNVTDQKEGLSKSNLAAIVSMVHTFVNAADGEPWGVESKEIREFKSMAEWTRILERHHFIPVSSQLLVLKDDPTENGMVAFVKAPQNLTELQQAASYLKNATRNRNAHCSTWIEWGNVRFSKQYAEFIQKHPSYAFDYIGHMKQHWTHFYEYFKLSRKEGLSLKEILFSSDFAMNAFIVIAASIQLILSKITSLPSSLVARLKQGENWRSITPLTELEKYEAEVENEYCNFIDHTPFYQFDYLSKIQKIWAVVWNSPERFITKASSILNAFLWTVQLLGKAAIAAPVKAIFSAEENKEPDSIQVIIKDPQNELDAFIKQWEEENKEQKIEVIYTTADGHKLVSMPRYRSFTQICGRLANTTQIQFLEVGGQKQISVDVLLGQLEATPQFKDARAVYEMQKLQDPKGRRYATYHVAVSALQRLQQVVGTAKIEYIHE